MYWFHHTYDWRQYFYLNVLSELFRFIATNLTKSDTVDTRCQPTAPPSAPWPRTTAPPPNTNCPENRNWLVCQTEAGTLRYRNVLRRNRPKSCRKWSGRSGRVSDLGRAQQKRRKEGRRRLEGRPLSGIQRMLVRFLLLSSIRYLLLLIIFVFIVAGYLLLLLLL